VTIPVKNIPKLASQPAKELAKVKVDGFGEGLLWPSLDVAISAPGLLEDFFGYPTRAEIARRRQRAAFQKEQHKSPPRGSKS
jgi:hypothetical protein